MTRYIYLKLLLLLSATSFAQTATQSYVTETVYKNGRNPSVLYTQTPADFSTTTYYDGMGRPIQQVQRNSSPVNDKNIVTHIEYEKNLGQTRQYLPFTAEGKVTTSGVTTYNANYAASAKQSVLDFYATDAYENTGNPYSETRYEASPSRRVLETAAPGTEWMLLVPEHREWSNTIRYDYDLNAANEVKKFSVSTTWDTTREVYTSTISEAGFYTQGSLSKNVVKNENWKGAHGTNNTTEEFKNSDGRVVLKRTYNNGEAYDTYYAYDFYGNLSYVIPPLANGSVAGTNLDKLCYQYIYDHKNRLVEKKLPQKQWEYIVYDKADRIVLTGPVINPFNAAATGWTLIKYDNQSRVVYTGFYSGHTVTAANRKALKASVYAQADNNESKQTADTTIDGVAVRYTNSRFPTAFNLLTVNYYDGYDFPGAPTSFTAVEGATPVQNVKGLTTGSWVRVLTTAAERKASSSYILYNAKYQPIRSYMSNYLGGYVQSDSQLTFRGIPVKTVTAHKKDAATAVLTVTNNFTYDHRERLKTQTQQLNGGAATVILENVYDELGALVTRKVGGSTSNPLQKVDYKYNIRGWLTDINNAEYYHTDTENDLFQMMLNYNKSGGFIGNESQYNGNINSVFVRTKSNNLFRGYAYHYDHLNRLTLAQNVFYKNSGWTLGVNADESYNEQVSYDKNGNILTMKRTGELLQGQRTETDDLSYSYDANQLLSLTDATNNPVGFNDGNKTGNDYTYDAFGNLKTDKNKSITGITYNHLNLPVEITFATGKISYVYDAAGTRLKKTVAPTTGTAQVTDYVNGFQYLNGSLQFFPHSEGYVKPNGTNAYLYVYQYKDHLGNVRLSYADCDGNGSINPATEILEENHYYPFGLEQAGYNELVNSCRNEEAEQYKYNGKEYEDSFGLNSYEMDLRQYDPAMARWVVQDPVIHHDYSPYSAFDNNPVYWSDPSGADSKPSINLSFQGDEAVQLIYNILVSIGTYTDKYDEMAALYGFDSYEEFVNTVGRTNQTPEGNNDGSTDGNGAGDVKGKGTVYIETNGIGHVYIQVNSVVFSYGRYNGSYSPQLGRYGPIGEGILYKYEGLEATNFIKERMKQSPTKSYVVNDLNVINAFNYLNNLYNEGKPVIDAAGNVKKGKYIDTYYLLGNNCSTIVSKALQEGGLGIGVYQTPSSLNQFFFTSDAIRNGYNPGLWGPKR